MLDTVYTQIDDKLKSQFSLAKYLGDDLKWDAAVDTIVKLKAAGSYAMQLDGRLDVAAWNIYGDPMLDWVLAVYNGARRVGSDEVQKATATAEIALAAGESVDITAPIRKADLGIVYEGESIIVTDGPDGSKQANLDGSGEVDVRFVWNAYGAVTVMNLSSFDWEIQATYFKYFKDEYLMAGAIIMYPAIEDIRSALAASEAKAQAQQFTGFARL